MAARIEGDNIVPVMKFSDNPDKTTNPGIKQVWRIRDKNGQAIADVIGIDDGTDIPQEGQRHCFWHPSADYRHFYYNIEGNAEVLLKKRIENGTINGMHKSLDETKAFSAGDLESFDFTYKRLLNPHIYKVSITGKLRSVKLELIQKYLGSKTK
jgi:nicotinate phosphoribosyltransferase